MTPDLLHAFAGRRFDLILADPPWSFVTWSAKGRRKSAKYPTMTEAELSALPVGELATPDSILILWRLGSGDLPEAAFRLVRAWGFRPQSEAVWHKPTLGLGYWFRSRHETLILATRGKPHAPIPSCRHQSVFSGRAAERRHSSKPSELRMWLDEAFPSASKLELFARGPAPVGWDTWGDEVTNEVADGVSGHSDPSNAELGL
jgi:N6-adenosine-specific RNA methylase IME4